MMPRSRKGNGITTRSAVISHNKAQNRPFAIQGPSHNTQGTLRLFNGHSFNSNLKFLFFIQADGWPFHGDLSVMTSRCLPWPGFKEGLAVPNVRSAVQKTWAGGRGREQEHSKNYLSRQEKLSFPPPSSIFHPALGSIRCCCRCAGCSSGYQRGTHRSRSDVTHSQDTVVLKGIGDGTTNQGQDSFL
ncbi:unnamed protein product [Arctogadus glacialis]